MTAKESALKIRMIEFQEQEIGLRALVKEISEQIDRVQKQKENLKLLLKQPEIMNVSVRNLRIRQNWKRDIMH